jgi:hypothetical protein
MREPSEGAVHGLPRVRTQASPPRPLHILLTEVFASRTERKKEGSFHVNWTTFVRGVPKLILKIVSINVGPNDAIWCHF